MNSLQIWKLPNIIKKLPTLIFKKNVNDSELIYIFELSLIVNYLSISMRFKFEQI